MRRCSSAILESELGWWWGGNKNKKNKKEKADEAHIKALPSREEKSANKEEGRADRMEGWRIF